MDILLQIITKKHVKLEISIICHTKTKKDFKIVKYAIKNVKY